MRGKNQVFGGHKRQSVHHEGNNALSSRRRNAISCDPSVGEKVELKLIITLSMCLHRTLVAFGFLPLRMKAVET